MTLSTAVPRRLLLLAGAALLVACAGTAGMAAAGVELDWLGQSAFKITSPGGKVIVTDPWPCCRPPCCRA